MLRSFPIAWALVAIAISAPASSALAAEDAEEHIGEVQQPYFTDGSACRMACAGLYGTACATISAACLSATTVTIGGAAIPCSVAIVTACGAGAAGMQGCMESCPP